MVVLAAIVSLLLPGVDCKIGLALPERKDGVGCRENFLQV
jgi:hypothetical protein